MKLIMVAIWDKKAKEAGPIVCVKNKDIADRWFNLELEKMPEVARVDFEFVLLGEYDNETLEVVGYGKAS